MRKIIVALDGLSGCGKSTTAKLCAEKLGYIYIDTGAMYRATTLYFKQHFIDITNPKAITQALSNIQITFHFIQKLGCTQTFLNGLNVEDEIRKMYISEMVSEVSAISEVRKHMVALQQKMGKKKGVVMDGRDIGTVVFPDAEVKIFMRADDEIRAFRRQQELIEKKQIVDLDEILANLKKRDLIDSTRSDGPLKKAEDAFVLDSSYMTLDEQVDYVINLVNSKIINSIKLDEQKRISFLDV
ncbi:MAG: (d)CMP kinase [Cytophagales bacterium]|nr:MAG: (d)CMP kinase [Cytophagales bacterium]